MLRTSFDIAHHYSRCTSKLKQFANRHFRHNVSAMAGTQKTLDDVHSGLYGSSLRLIVHPDPDANFSHLRRIRQRRRGADLEFVKTILTRLMRIQFHAEEAFSD